MIPKEKAEELIDKFYPIDGKKKMISDSRNVKAKKYALICVNEIINSVLNQVWSPVTYQYWLDVKQEIEKL